MKKSSKSGLFLMELVLAIVLFAIASGVCVQLFITAHRLSHSSSDVTRAVAAAQNAAECFHSTGGDGEDMAQILGGIAEGSIVFVRFDENWNPAFWEDAVYGMQIELTESGDMRSAGISVESIKRGETLFEITAKKYMG